MKKILVAYASTTGNTEMMAQAIAKGAESNGAQVDLVNLADNSPAVDGYDVIVLGSPAMGCEVLEESYMEPFFTSIESSISGKNIALFGSYDWGEGEWLTSWEDRVKAAGANLAAESLKINLTPDAAGEGACAEFGKKISA
ncbi:MAG: flavodoxin [Treponemataceae bacterium]|nr:flavodoxin [Treponemataceae bacterium]